MYLLEKTKQKKPKQLNKIRLINNTKITIPEEFIILLCLLFCLQQCQCLKEGVKNTYFHKNTFVNDYFKP